MAQENPGDKLVNDVKEIPSKTADTLTLGPQRRKLSKYVQDEESKASSALKGQWDQFKELMSKDEPKKPLPRKR